MFAILFLLSGCNSKQNAYSLDNKNNQSLENNSQNALLKELIEKKETLILLLKDENASLKKENARIKYLLDDMNAVERRMLFMSDLHHWSQVYYCNKYYLTWLPGFCSASSQEIEVANQMKDAGFPEDFWSALNAICLSILIFLIFCVAITFVSLKLMRVYFLYLNPPLRYKLSPFFKKKILDEWDEFNKKCLTSQKKYDELNQNLSNISNQISDKRNEQNRIQVELDLIKSRYKNILDNHLNQILEAAKESEAEAKRRAEILLMKKP